MKLGSVKALFTNALKSVRAFPVRLRLNAAMMGIVSDELGVEALDEGSERGRLVIEQATAELRRLGVEP